MTQPRPRVLSLRTIIILPKHVITLSSSLNPILSKMTQPRPRVLSLRTIIILSKHVITLCSSLLHLTCFFWYLFIYLFIYLFVSCGPGSSVGIATELRAGRSGIDSRWGWDFPPVQTGPGDHPASCKMGTGSFPEVKCGRGVLLTTHPLLVPRSWNSRAITLPALWAT